MNQLKGDAKIKLAETSDYLSALLPLDKADDMACDMGSERNYSQLFVYGHSKNIKNSKGLSRVFIYEEVEMLMIIR